LIVSRIYGGVGNQLFQYAFGLLQARKLKAELKLDKYILDVNPFHYTPYDFELKHFENSYSPLVELLFGLNRKSTCCSNCKNESIQ
jgi:hypothetical protein